MSRLILQKEALIGKKIINSLLVKKIISNNNVNQKSIKTLASDKPLEESDKKIFKLLNLEKKRQLETITLIPSENYASESVLKTLSSEISNKYSEGYPGARYYGGNEIVDLVEKECQKRALEVFNLNPKEWGVNVQALSGTSANIAVYGALLNPFDKFMGLELTHGGHLSHGYEKNNKKISATSKYFTSIPYFVSNKTGIINYDELEIIAKSVKPKIIVAGASSYPRLIDYERIRNIADSIGNNCYVMSDISHISGLIASNVIPSPFDYSDVITTTTHKLLRGPRAALIFYRCGERKFTTIKNKKVNDDKENLYDLEGKINFSIFPGHQGGPHENTIASIAVCLNEALDRDNFKKYTEQVLLNAKVFANELISKGFKLVTDGTDNHLVLIDFQGKIDGARVEFILDCIGISTNKNTIVGDKSAFVPGGLRLGTPAMTTRGFKEKEFIELADIIKIATEETIKLKAELRNDGIKTISQFNQRVKELLQESTDTKSTAHSQVKKILEMRKRVSKLLE